MKRRAHYLTAMWMLCLSVIMGASLTCYGQRQMPARRSGTALPTKPAPPPDGQIRYKGIFEPVNYPDDLGLNSVFFANENEGWIAAAQGTILHPTEGGRTCSRNWAVTWPAPTQRSIRFIS